VIRPVPRRLCAAVVLVLAGFAAPALAQESSRVDLVVGGVFTGAAAAGSVDATLIDPAGNPLTLFRTTNRIAPGFGVEGMISARLRERVRLELSVGWASTDFESTISGDFEDVPPVTATQKVNQYTVDVSLSWRLLQRGRLAIFIRGGGGGFREITDDRSLVDNGRRASVGAGAQVRLRQADSGWFGRLALRADVRAQARGAGIAFGESGTRVFPSVFAGLVIGQ
jgi:hypothetical protein